MIAFLAGATFLRRSNGLLAPAWLALVPVTLATRVIATKQERDADVQDVVDRLDGWR